MLVCFCVLADAHKALYYIQLKQQPEQIVRLLFSKKKKKQFEKLCFNNLLLIQLLAKCKQFKIVILIGQCYVHFLVLF